MNEICMHKKLLAYNIKKQLDTGINVDGEILVVENLEIFCTKCEKWFKVV